jgi:hypothetical protein
MASQGLGDSAASFSRWLDEVRWSGTGRAPEWIASECLNQIDPDNFYRVAPLEPLVSAGVGSVRLFRKGDVPEATEDGLNLSYGLEANESGELTKVVYPYGGYLRWVYRTWEYAGSTGTRRQRGW